MPLEHLGIEVSTAAAVTAWLFVQAETLQQPLSFCHMPQGCSLQLFNPCANLFTSTKPRLKVLCTRGQAGGYSMGIFHLL